ncbi:winged helix-turn-helix domain-containing protein [Natronomonas marina]|uniref:winged helix-turn-helix domain-containing protein n=1 Tax=Natronomonas marina TaxID=2961939 RepID=UPI0020C93A93|nr:winged helix-turn-helix domain-containing protein [Natronomonas marina]
MANERPRAENGTWEPETEPEEILDVMRPVEPYGTTEIAELLDLPQSTANYRLNKLADEGVIRKKKLHGQTVAWYRPPEGWGESK